MKNINAKITNTGKLALFIDPTVKGEPTQNGNSIKVAFTNRFEKLELDGLEGGDYSLMVMLTRKTKTKRKAKPEEDEDFDETPKKNKGKKPNLNKDVNGKVKAIASSNRPADRLKTKRNK